MIEKYVRYEGVCDNCNSSVVRIDTNRKSKVLSRLRNSGWRIEGDKLTCPNCIRCEKERQEEERRKMEEERARVEEEKKFCKKCGCRVADVYDGGKYVGVYCAECKEERLDA